MSETNSAPKAVRVNLDWKSKWPLFFVYVDTYQAAPLGFLVLPPKLVLGHLGESVRRSPCSMYFPIKVSKAKACADTAL